jgi:hypothetical protein
MQVPCTISKISKTGRASWFLESKCEWSEVVANSRHVANGMEGEGVAFPNAVRRLGCEN